MYKYIELREERNESNDNFFFVKIAACGTALGTSGIKLHLAIISADKVILRNFVYPYGPSAL